MKYEKELRKIRNELGENTKIIELSPNKQIVINLDDFERRIDEHVTSENPSQIISEAQNANDYLNSMCIISGKKEPLSLRKAEINNSLLKNSKYGQMSMSGGTILPPIDESSKMKLKKIESFQESAAATKKQFFERSYTSLNH